MLNDLFATLGIEAWKPVLTALLLPPVPLLLTVLLGARLILWRRGIGWLVVVLSVALLWLSACAGAAEALRGWLLHPPRALGAAQIADMKGKRPAVATAIVVLGGGREALAPEYGVSSLAPPSLERLRYGLWLSRETGWPVAFSGGVGYAQRGVGSEAETAARIARSEFARPLRWVEPDSRDTRENARLTLALLAPDHIARVVLVTHATHMPRAVRNFEEAARGRGAAIEVVPAPVGWAPRVEQPLLRWLPGHEGFDLMRQTLREALGRLAGA